MEAIMAKKTPGCAGCPRNLLSSLGMHFGGCHSSPTGRRYTGTRVAKKRVKRLCEENQPADASDYRVRKPESWWELSTRNCEANYFSLGPVSKAYRAVDNLVTCGIGSVDGCAISIRSKGRHGRRDHLLSERRREQDELEFVEAYLKANSLSALYDSVFIPVIIATETDHAWSECFLYSQAVSSRDRPVDG